MSKKILYVTTRLPYPLIGGDRLHIYHYLSELKKRGHEIHVETQGVIGQEDTLTDQQIKDADVVILDKEYSVVNTFVKGKKIEL